MKKSVFLSIFLVLMIPLMLLAEDNSSKPNIEEVVKKLDKLYRSESSYAEMEMEIVTPHWERTLTMDVWTKGINKTFIRIKSPPKEKGVATLRIKNEMWNYLPKVNKVMKVPPSMMMSSWMGSDFTNDDLVKEYTMKKDYNYEFITPKETKDNLLYLKFIPKEGRPIVWSKVTVAVRKSDYLPVWQKYYDDKGNLMRTLNFKKIKEFDDRKIPSVMEMIPQNKEGHKTIVRYKKAEFDIKVDDEVFTLRNLRSRR